MEIFPNILLRIGGGSFENLATMKSQEMISMVINLQDKIEQKECLKEELSKNIFSVIKGSESKKSQNILQNIRRNIYNERKIRDEDIEAAVEILPKEVAFEVQAFLQISTEISQLILVFDETYQKVVSRNRSILQALSKQQELTKGLLLSSHALYNSLETFRTKATDDFRKKELKTELGVQKFLSRIYAKTTPFSTFTTIALAGLDEHSEQGIVHNEAGRLKRTSVLRLNNNLFKLIQEILASYKDFYIHLPVRLNPTLTTTSNGFKYLTNHNNVEAFQQLAANPVIYLIIDILKNAQNGIKFDHLLFLLAKHIEADNDELSAYLKDLLRIGLLENYWGISGTDPKWSEKLVHFLASFKEFKIICVAELIRALEQLHEIARRYEIAADVSRVDLLRTAHSLIREIYLKLHEAAGLPAEERLPTEELQSFLKEKHKDSAEENETKQSAFKHKSSTVFSFQPEHIFYEDTFTDAKIQFSKKQVVEIVKLTNSLIEGISCFQLFEEEKDELAKFYLDKYGDDSDIFVLQFYEDFYRKIISKGKEGKDGKDEKDANLSKKTPKSRQNQLLENWERNFRKSVPLVAENSDCINLKTTDIHTVNLLTKIKPVGGESLGAFLQFYIDDSGGDSKSVLKAVLNSMTPGYGKLLSRFLHLFDESITSKIKKYNSKLASIGEIYLETSDASYFNANLHPALMDYEVRIPGSHHSLPPDQQLDIKEFSLCYDKAVDRLRVKHSTSDRMAYFYDLGFQGHRGRSPLFKLLNKFTKTVYAGVSPILGVINKEFQSPENVEQHVRHFPRVVFENILVLQRKGWGFPLSLIPTKAPTDNESQYFFKVNQWRLSFNMPPDVFVRLIPPSKSEANNVVNSAGKLGKDDYKPQYIDFTNPLLVRLFYKLVEKKPESIKIEEMLPAPSQLMKIGGERYVSEAVTFWYNYENRS